MARLPIPGKDSGTWGAILNDYLSQAHNADGSLKDNAVTTINIQDDSLSKEKLAPIVQASLDQADSSLQISNNLSDLANARTARTNLGVAPDGSTVTMGTVINQTYRDNTTAYPSFPAGAITKIATMPSGKIAQQGGFFIYNTTGSAINFSLYYMADNTTPTDPADRAVFISCAANSLTVAAFQFLVVSGQTIWGLASAVGLNVYPPLLTIDTPTNDQAWYSLLMKNIPTTDTIARTAGAGYYAEVPLGAFVHNTTGSAITITTSIKRSGAATGAGVFTGVADSSPFVIHTASISANSQATWLSGNTGAVALLGGDSVYIRASAPGLNFYGAYRERPIAGL